MQSPKLARQKLRRDQHSPVRQQHGLRRVDGERFAPERLKRGDAFARGRAQRGGGFPRSRADERRHKLPLANGGMRIHPARFSQRKIRMCGQKSLDRALVLLARKGAGRVNEPAAGLEQQRRALQDLLLPRGAGEHMLLRPFTHGGFVLAKHSLPGAGRIHHRHIKTRAERKRQRVRAHTGHQRVGHAQPFDVPREDFRAVAHRLVGNQQPRVLHHRRELRGLATRRGAKIEHRHA